HAYIIPYMKYHLDISILHTKKDCPQSFDCQQSEAQCAFLFSPLFHFVWNFGMMKNGEENE
ncbi:hypothetical protein, partial [Sharpea azabuensis]|uniref:hypothetical protein n=1 Tax=Sharpea azabuensis TaxID=322505 RepID=UPI0023F4852A